ncbi:MAG: cell envelope integrity protein TolA, partial [Pseudomonadota bacterium]|nr:cell envelope integrity protein TolA [Pseudomonadota bacterium]
LAEEIADEPPPGAELGLDAEGGAGSDAFGLIGKKGGRSLLGGDGSAFGWYGRIVQEDLQNQLQQLEEVRALSYTVVVKIWLSPVGDVETAMIERGSGDPEVDGRLERAIARNVRISSAPPQDMPQPIRLRVTSRI